MATMIPVRLLLSDERVGGDNVLKCVVTRALETIPQSCVKCITSDPLTTHQFSVQFVQPFPSYRKREGAHVYPTVSFFKTLT